MRRTMTLSVALSIVVAGSTVRAQEWFSLRIRQAAGIPQPLWRLDIWVDRYSTDAERDRLVCLLASQTEEQLSNLRSAGDLLPHDIGRFRHVQDTSPNFRLALQFGGWDPPKWSFHHTRPIEYARSTPTDDGGRLVTVVTPPRGRAYLFGVIQFRVDADGRGSGKMFEAANLRFGTQGTLEVHDWDTRRAFEVVHVRGQTE